MYICKKNLPEEIIWETLQYTADGIRTRTEIPFKARNYGKFYISCAILCAIFAKRGKKTMIYDPYSSPNDPEFAEELRAMTEDDEDDENAQ